MRKPGIPYHIEVALCSTGRRGYALRGYCRLTRCDKWLSRDAELCRGLLCRRVLIVGLRTEATLLCWWLAVIVSSDYRWRFELSPVHHKDLATMSCCQQKQWQEACRGNRETDTPFIDHLMCLIWKWQNSCEKRDTKHEENAEDKSNISYNCSINTDYNGIYAYASVQRHRYVLPKAEVSSALELNFLLLLLHHHAFIPHHFQS